VNKVVFRLSAKSALFTTFLVAGLLVFVWVHWRGQRQTELIVFSVLTVLAMTIYTVRTELSLSVGSREISGKRIWLGIAIRTVTVRVGSGDALYLTEDVVNSGTQGIDVWHKLEASGQLVSPQSDAPGPYVLSSQVWVRRHARLAEFAGQAAEILGVPLQDSRKFTEGIDRFRDGAS